MADKKPLVRQLKFEKSQLDKVNQGLRDAQKDIDAVLRRAPRGGIGDKVTRLQAEQQLKVINGILDKNYDSLDKILQASQKLAAELGSEVVSDYEETLTDLILDPDKRATIRSSEAQRVANNIDSLVRRQIGSARPLSERVYDTAKLSKGLVDRAINSGLAQGLNHRQLANKIAPMINPDVKGGVSYASQRLARTELNNAYHAASVERYKHSFVEGVDWNLSSSHPEGDECDGLASNSPYDMEEVPAKPHPLCFCFLTPGLPSEEDFMKNLFDGKYDDGEEFGDFGKAAIEREEAPAFDISRFKVSKDGSDIAVPTGLVKGVKPGDPSATAQQQAVWTYTATSKNINDKLRAIDTGVAKTGLNKKQQALHDELFKLTNENTLKQDTMLFRAVKKDNIRALFGDDDDIMNSVGRTYRDGAFLSTSYGESSLEGFGAYQLNIMAAKGTRAANIADYGIAGSQREVLLPPGSNFRVMGVRKVKYTVQERDYSVRDSTVYKEVKRSRTELDVVLEQDA